MNTQIYLLVYNDLKSRINDRELKPRERLPIEPELAKNFGVSIGTVRKAVAKLVEEGFLVRQQGRGTFVVDPERDIDFEIKLNGVNSSENKNSLSIGYVSDLWFQEKVNEILWDGYGDRVKNVWFPKKLISSKNSVEDSEYDLNWKNCSIVQIATHIFHLPRISESFHPFPDWLVDKLSGMFDPKILRECRSSEGRLRLLPILANSTMCFINKRIFRESSIPIPSKDWTWDDFLSICRILKKNEKIPFGLVFTVANLFEPLLWQAGGDFISETGEVSLDKKAYGEMIDFLKTLRDEKLILDILKLPYSMDEAFKEYEIGMTFQTSFLTHLIKDQIQDWTVCDLPQNKEKASCVAINGLAVPYSNENPDEAFEILWDLFQKGNMKNLASTPTVFPACKKYYNLWDGNGIENASLFGTAIDYARPLPVRCGFWKWKSDVLKCFEDAVYGKLAVEDSRLKVISMIEEKLENEYEI